MTKCLVLICGPPACLKSTLARILRLLFNYPPILNLQFLCLANLYRASRSRGTFLSFDHLLSDYENEIIENESNWKAYRSLLADGIERILLGKPRAPLPDHLQYAPPLLDRLSQALTSLDPHGVLFIEDNFYYSSMRHRYRQIAQRARLGFVCIHLYANFSVACRRNAQRPCSQRVSDTSMANIYSKYELFADDFVINTTERGLTSEHLQRVLHRVDRACQQPEEPVEAIDDEQRRRATEINQQNLLYQLDQQLRKLVSKCLQDAFARDARLQTPSDKRRYAEKINERRQAFMELVRRRFILLDAKDDVESAFKCFLHERNELDGQDNDGINQ